MRALWPAGHGIPGPVLTEDDVRRAVDAFRHENGEPPYKDVFRRMRELQGEEGFTSIRKEGTRYQLQSLDVSQKREPRAQLTKAEWETLKELYGTGYEDTGLVCCKENGTVWKPSAFTSAYRDLLRRRRIANIPFHNLRHSHASQLLRDGVNPKVIAERLGHSKVGFTLDVYSHVLPGMQEEAARRVDVLLKGALGG